jgi:hypothetical protein
MLSWSGQYVNDEESRKHVQEWDPSQVLDRSRKEVPVPESVFQKCKSKVPDCGEDDNASEEDFERVEVEPVDLRSEAEKEVVEDGADSSSGNTVCKVLVNFRGRQKGGTDIQ